ncbi:MAG: divalent-cation tolerance protein CutA, partial [Nanoarchaeota archaeon]
YIVCKDKKEARKISKHLLDKKLVACVNIFPIESMYWWDDKIEESKEVVVLAKTKEGNYKKIKQEVEKIHSYDVPAIIRLGCESNKDYSDWIDKVVS